MKKSMEAMNKITIIYKGKRIKIEYDWDGLEWTVCIPSTITPESMFFEIIADRDFNIRTIHVFTKMKMEHYEKNTQLKELFNEFMKTVIKKRNETN